MNERINRRDFLKMSSAAAVGGAAVMTGCATAAGGGTESAASIGFKADLPKAKGPRLVVVGAGTSGLTVAKYAKKEHPQFDVVLVEKRDMYSSCFSSNLWYAGLINLEFLADHSFLDAARNNHYIYFNATVTGLDRAGRKLVTSEGEIDYDFLVLAPGISYDYSRIGVKDVEAITALRTDYPPGFISPTEHVTIRRKVQEFEGGVFVQCVPSGNYRCLPAPYERACMIASEFKKNKIKGKVLVLDANPEITIKAKGFHAAFNELYKDIIEYKPSIEITSVDLEKKASQNRFRQLPLRRRGDLSRRARLDPDRATGPDGPEKPAEGSAHRRPEIQRDRRRTRLRDRRLAPASVFQERKHVQHRGQVRGQGAGGARPGQGHQLVQSAHRLLLDGQRQSDGRHRRGCRLCPERRRKCDRRILAGHQAVRGP